MAMHDIEDAARSFRALVRSQNLERTRARRALVRLCRQRLRATDSIEEADALWRICPLRSSVRKEAKRKAARLVVEAARKAIAEAATLQEARKIADRPIRPYVYGERYGQIREQLRRRARTALKGAACLEEYVIIFLYGALDEVDSSRNDPAYLKILSLNPSREELRRVRSNLGRLRERMQNQWNWLCYDMKKRNE